MRRLRHVTVLPSDADALVAAGRLDRGLFAVTALLAQRYDPAHTDALPLTVERADGMTASSLDELTGLAEKSSVRRLDSTDAHAMRVGNGDLGRFWKTLVPADGQRTKAADAPRVWLDGRVSASLDRSTARIGAPDVWSAGYRGDGVKVAVLDTGADQTHPDLAGRVTAARTSPAAAAPETCSDTALTWRPSSAAVASPRGPAAPAGAWRPARGRWSARCSGTTVSAVRRRSSRAWNGRRSRVPMSSS